MSLPGIDRLRAEIAMLEGERARRTGSTPKLDHLIVAKQRSLALLEKVAASLTCSPRTTRSRKS